MKQIYSINGIGCFTTLGVIILISSCNLTPKFEQVDKEDVSKYLMDTILVEDSMDRYSLSIRHYEAGMNSDIPLFILAKTSSQDTVFYKLEYQRFNCLGYASRMDTLYMWSNKPENDVGNYWYLFSNNGRLIDAVSYPDARIPISSSVTNKLYAGLYHLEKDSLVKITNDFNFDDLQVLPNKSDWYYVAFYGHGLKYKISLKDLKVIEVDN